MISFQIAALEILLGESTQPANVAASDLPTQHRYSSRRISALESRDRWSRIRRSNLPAPRQKPIAQDRSRRAPTSWLDSEHLSQITKRAGHLLKNPRTLCPTSDNRSYVRFGLGFPRVFCNNRI